MSGNLGLNETAIDRLLHFIRFQVFNNFKSEMAQMTKKIKKLEKEIQMWKGRWESSNTQLEKVTKEKENGEADLKEARSKANKLEKLCRALQQERYFERC